MYNLLHKKFGRWTILFKNSTKKRGQFLWHCVCECGIERDIETTRLVRGVTKSCGCSSVINLLGQKFNKLTALYRNGSNKKKLALWHCICECGNEHDVAGSHLISGDIKSCGCLFRLSTGVAAMNTLYRNYQETALKRNIVFNLTIEDFHKLTKQNCHYCNIPPIQRRKVPFTNGDYIYNGIDRINNNIGYELDNCLPCCKFCNGSKCKMTYNEFKAHIKRLSEFKFWEKN